MPFTHSILLFGPDAKRSALQKLLAAMDAQPDSARRLLYKNLIDGLFDNGLWPLISFLYITAAHDLQAASLNIRKPGQFTLAPLNSPTFDVDLGYTGNGVSAELDTGFRISSSPLYAKDSAHLGVFVLTNVEEAKPAIGVQSSAYAHIVPRQPTNTMSVRCNNSSDSTSPLQIAGILTSAGHSAWSRTRASFITAYKDGVSVGTSNTVSTTRPIESIRLLRGANAFATCQVAAAHAGGGLSDDNLLSLYTLVAAILSGIGAV